MCFSPWVLALFRSMCGLIVDYENVYEYECVIKKHFISIHDTVNT